MMQKLQATLLLTFMFIIQSAIASREVCTNAEHITRHIVIKKYKPDDLNDDCLAGVTGILPPNDAMYRLCTEDTCTQMNDIITDILNDTEYPDCKFNYRTLAAFEKSALSDCGKGPVTSISSSPSMSPTSSSVAITPMNGLMFIAFISSVLMNLMY